MDGFGMVGLCAAKRAGVGQGRLSHSFASATTEDIAEQEKRADQSFAKRFGTINANPSLRVSSFYEK